MPVTTRSAAPEKQSLYERDYYSWALEQARALSERRIEDLDWENLAEEVGDLATRQRRALTSQSARLIEHLLKSAFARSVVLQNNRRIWDLSLREARRAIRRRLAESPGLQSSAHELFEEAWLDGRDEALKFLELPDDAIPETPTWSFEQAMDDNFNPVN